MKKNNNFRFMYWYYKTPEGDVNVLIPKKEFHLANIQVYQLEGILFSNREIIKKDRIFRTIEEQDVLGKYNTEFKAFNSYK